MLHEYFINASRGSVCTILHARLNLSKVCARWVPKDLTEEHKLQRIEAAFNLRELYEKEGDSLWERIVTGDESWVHHYTPETKQQSKQWVKKGGRPPKKFKTQMSAGKVLLTAFWDCKGVVYQEYLPHGETVNAARYLDTLENLRKALRIKRPGLLSKGVLLIHDNARPHSAKITQAFLKQLGWEVLSHPPHSPDLAPSDYHLFPFLKVALGGRRFHTDEEVKEAVKIFFQKQDTNWYLAGIQKLLSRYNKCIDEGGDYVEK